ncbi:MAG: spermidine synthase [Alphaproteobacteria bacterium]|nr:spermidine synthase [Alphaproteobacteria bacterium]
MSKLFEELDYQPTPIGAVSLRRRRDLPTNEDIYEIKLGDEFLMSSQFTVSEIELARTALAHCGKDNLDVLVGGLGLGYTALEVLRDARVRSLHVVDALAAVIEWHETGLLPLGPKLTSDPRCGFVHGDFFALAASAQGFDPDLPGRRYDAIIVDIDHSPDFLLTPDNQEFYSPAGLRQLTAHLHPDGIFALWSNDRPDEDFTARLAAEFEKAWAQPVTFHNPLQDRRETQTVYLAR